jgi:acyl dehydratase
VAIEAQLAELHHRMFMLKTERGITIDLTIALAQARDVTAAITCDGARWPAFVRASPNVATAIMLLDTLPAPSADGVDTMYQQLKEILGIAVAQEVESSL